MPLPTDDLVELPPSILGVERRQSQHSDIARSAIMNNHPPSDNASTTSEPSIMSEGPDSIKDFAVEKPRPSDAKMATPSTHRQMLGQALTDTPATTAPSSPQMCVFALGSRQGFADTLSQRCSATGHRRRSFASTTNHLGHPRSDQIQGLPGRPNRAEGCRVKARDRHGGLTSSRQELYHEEDLQILELATTRCKDFQRGREEARGGPWPICFCTTYRRTNKGTSFSTSTDCG